MKTLDRFVAFLLLLFFIGYVYLSFQFHLLPFEKLQSFKPNTLPKGLGIIGIVVSLVVLFQAQGEENKDNKNWKNYEWKQLIFMVVAMFIYAANIKTVGFILSTTLFLVIGSAILGERNWLKMIIISAISSTIIWLLVDKLLGIYLNPLPIFIAY